LKELHGAIGVTVTPFDLDWRIDLNTIHEQAEKLAGTEIAGVFPCASTGEFPHLSMTEQRLINQATREGIGSGKALIAGACAPNLRGAIDFAAMAAELGYDACVACPPYYYPLAQEEIFQFYRELAQASTLPVILYHVPFFTSGIAAETVEKLMRIPNIIGIKDSSANMKRIAHLCQLHAVREDFLIYTGTDDCLLPALAAGVDGSMTAFAAAAPKLVTEVYRAFAMGNLQAAAANQRRMMQLLKTADALPFPLGYKLVAEVYHELPMTRQTHQMVTQQQVNDARHQIAKQMAQALAGDE